MGGTIESLEKKVSEKVGEKLAKIEDSFSRVETLKRK